MSARGATAAIDLPIGTVTFLFTDIEGSTRLVQDLGADYAQLVADHGRILRGAIRSAGGREVGSEGDSFFAVFRNASAAVAAAVQAQRELRGHRWPGAVDVRVRMGLHTGEGMRGGDNYVGLDVHRAARISAAGHGGQVVLSDATRSLVEHDVSADLGLRDLGPHRLKDLARPEHLWQLEIAGLPADFPALRTLDARDNNLPVQLTSFVGREAEIAAVGERLERARLVTLTGPGGTGKTRLALQVAAERLSRYADGAFFVELAPVREPGMVASAIASTIGVREELDRPIVDAIKDALRDKELLLVLDNFEHLASAAPIVSDLLSAVQRLQVVVTSRAVLHLYGEHEYAVAPLRIPDASRLPSLAELSHYEGIALFVERAMAARPDFAITNDSAPAVAEIVARLDGLPLAIELAAAKVKLLGPEAILGRLGSRLAFLGGGARDLPARQQTLRQAIEWSYDLLPDAEQAFLRRLAVFVGGCTVEAVDAVCHPADLGLDPLAGLTALVDQSLVRLEEAAHGEPRFVMLETIREFGLDRLAEAGEVDDFRRRHLEHFTSVGEALEPSLLESSEASDRIGHDHDNFRAALAWAIEAGDPERGLRLGFALWRFWQQRGHLREGREWFDRLIGLPRGAASPASRAKGLTGAAGIAYWQNDYAAAQAWYDEAEAIIRELGDPAWLADALYNSGSVALLRGDIDATSARLAESTAIARAVGDGALIGRFLEADGYTAFMRDDLARARSLLEESLALAEARGDRMATASGHHSVAQVARLDGRLTDAAHHYRLALDFAHEVGGAATVIEPLQGLAAVAIATGDAELGVGLLAASDAIRQELGGGPPPEWLRLGDPLADARRTLSAEAYDQAWEAGRALGVDEAVRLALGKIGR